jgi:protein SCO1/2
VGLGGPLELVDHTGQPFTLHALGGKPALLFFGFTHCGESCPPALAVAREVLAGFGTGPAPAVLFVTLDPQADRPDDLALFLAKVDPRLIGLTGTAEQVERAVERYGVGVRGAGAALQHSAVWYLLDRQGALRRVYPHSTPPGDLLADLRTLGAHRDPLP